MEKVPLTLLFWEELARVGMFRDGHSWWKDPRGTSSSEVEMAVGLGSWWGLGGDRATSPGLEGAGGWNAKRWCDQTQGPIKLCSCEEVAARG